MGRLGWSQKALTKITELTAWFGYGRFLLLGYVAQELLKFG